GAAKTSQKDFGRFLQISLGSSFELETQLLLCNDLKFLADEQTTIVYETIDRLQRQINSMLKYVGSKTKNLKPNT
ncbi:MAG: four helix bundle protein, partial [Flavobacterium sp.]